MNKITGKFNQMYEIVKFYGRIMISSTEFDLMN